MRLIKPYSHLNSEFGKNDIRIIHTPRCKKDFPWAIVSVADLTAALPPEETQVITDAWSNALKKETLVDEKIVSVRLMDWRQGSYGFVLRIIEFGKQRLIKVFMPYLAICIFRML